MNKYFVNILKSKQSQCLQKQGSYWLENTYMRNEMGVSGFSTTLFTNFNLSNLSQLFIKNTVEK